jgi:hypothetical protein
MLRDTGKRARGLIRVRPLIETATVVMHRAAIGRVGEFARHNSCVTAFGVAYSIQFSGRQIVAHTICSVQVFGTGPAASGRLFLHAARKHYRASSQRHPEKAARRQVYVVSVAADLRLPIMQLPKAGRR